MVLSVVVAGRPPQYTARSGCTYYLFIYLSATTTGGNAASRVSPTVPQPARGCSWGGHNLEAACGAPHFTRLVWLIPRPEPLDEGSHDSIRPVAPSCAPNIQVKFSSMPSGPRGSTSKYVLTPGPYLKPEETKHRGMNGLVRAWSIFVSIFV